MSIERARAIYAIQFDPIHMEATNSYNSEFRVLPKETEVFVDKELDILSQAAYRVHENFDTETWKDKPSFHNTEHLKAVERAGILLAEEALKPNGKDPLNIKSGLSKWNQGHPEAKIQEDELVPLLKFVVSMHDNGNVARNIEYENEGDGVVAKPEYFTAYKSKGAEDRTAKMIADAIGASSLSQSQKDRYTVFAQHLVDKTKMLFAEGQIRDQDAEPFALFMMVIDQVGNEYFNENPNSVHGLITEMAVENPDTKVNLSTFYNFSSGKNTEARGRFETLIPEKDKRDQILGVWGKKEKPINEIYPDKDIKAGDMAKVIILLRDPQGLTSQNQKEIEDLMGMKLEDFPEVWLPDKDSGEVTPRVPVSK